MDTERKEKASLKKIKKATRGIRKILRQFHILTSRLSQNDESFMFFIKIFSYDV